MTGHFTSYENRTDHELATFAPREVDSKNSRPLTSARWRNAA
jgi:hypothetical protein